MKSFRLIILLILITNISFGQNLNFEDQLIQEFIKERENQNVYRSFVADISGICDAFTTITNQDALIGWDDCEGSVYEGTIEFEAVDGFRYNVYSTNDQGTAFNDMSFGSYYSCFDINNQNSMYNNDADSPTLYFNVDEFGEISFSGASQWGEVFTLFDVSMNDAELNFKWTNDYGEGAEVQLERQDGQSWVELFSPCNICSPSDSLALVAIYNATDGPNWHIPWDLTNPVSQWHGVTLNESCCVSELNLGRSVELTTIGIFTGNNLIGEIPTDIADLTSLVELNLSVNQLEGEILPSLTDLTNLEVLLLNQNQFSGTVLPDISNLENLRLMSLSRNNFTGSLPNELASLNNLETFFASDNKLDGQIPTQFGDFQSLRNLSIWGNNISGEIPSELGNIQTLSNLTMGFNNLSGEIPPSLGEIPNLTVLRLSFNQLSGNVPSGFPSLFILRLNDNDLSGEFPNSLGSLFGIPELNLSNNNFTGPIPSYLIVNNETQLVYFANNDFSGCVDSIENLCTKPFNPVLDTALVGGVVYLASYSNGYDLTGNPKLAWEGDMQNSCNDQEQIGAPCNDSDSETNNEGINEDCECVDGVVSTIEIEELNSIYLSPNPLTAGESMKVHLDLTQNLSIVLTIINIDGQVIQKKSVDAKSGINSISIKTGDLNKGLYFLQLSSSEGVTSRKVVIQ